MKILKVQYFMKNPKIFKFYNKLDKTLFYKIDLLTSLRGKYRMGSW